MVQLPWEIMDMRKKNRKFTIHHSKFIKFYGERKYNIKIKKWPWPQHIAKTTKRHTYSNEHPDVGKETQKPKLERGKIFRFTIREPIAINYQYKYKLRFRFVQIVGWSWICEKLQYTTQNSSNFTENANII